tara:strand:- start:407 stop:565 length:159 start_codon:yes stop_codon:yes gene_type:complete
MGLQTKITIQVEARLPKTCLALLVKVLGLMKLRAMLDSLQKVALPAFQNYSP